MKIWKNAMLGTAIAALTATGALACEADGRVSIIGNEFPAIQTVAAAAGACTGIDFSSNLTADHQTLNVAGMSGNLDAGETAILVAILWGAIALYAGLGWGLHYAVRR